MSKMKKVISLVLCIVMLAGTFTFLGDLIVPVAEAAGTSQVKDFATVDAEYDDYIYLGLDVIEVANGELTDGFVNAGDWLEYRMTVLSDFYVGNTAPVFIYDRNFFDVRVVTSTTPSTSATFEKADYEGNKKFTDGTFMNGDHPVAPQNGEIASYNTLTAFPYGNVATQLGFCEIDKTTYQNWDFVKTNLGVTSSVTNTNFLMQTDEWITSWYVRVKEGLADGTTGKSFSLTSIYKNQINPATGAGDNRRLGDIYTADALGTYASAKAMNVRYKEIKNLILDDCTHTFTIGKGAVATFTVDNKTYGEPVKALTGSEINAPEIAPSKDGFEFKGWALKGTTDILTFPQTMGEANVTYVAVFEASGGETPEIPVVKYTVKFVKYTDKEAIISANEYEENTEVTVPTEEGIIAWVLNGKFVELGETVTATEDITYEAVYNTDKFDIKINLNGGSYAEDAELPEGAKVENGVLIVKAGLYEEFDLTTLPLPEKEGHTAKLSAEKVKVDKLTGANVRIDWTVDTYTAKFYLDKAAYEAGEEAVATATFRYGTDMTAAFNQANVGMAALKPEKKFVGWKNVETNEAVANTAIFAEDVAFYGDWTDFSGTLIIWGRDYENGGWKELTTKYADAGTTVKLSDIKALVTEANYGTSAAKYVVAGSASTFSNDTAIRSDFKMAEGTSNVYIFTNTEFKVTFKTPVFDEDGFITDEFAGETTIFNSLTDDTFLTTDKALAETPAEHKGYKFVCWTDAEGNEFAPGRIVLDYANGVDYTFTAKYELVEYTIKFAVDNESDIKELLTVEGTFKVGDTLKLSEAAVVDEEGKAALLPVIGVENGEQDGGPYRNVDGMKFSGWKVGTQAANLVDYNIEEEVVLTPAFIKDVTLNETIRIKGYWEALPYDFVAYYAKSFDAEGKPNYEAMPAVSVNTGASLADAYAAAKEFAENNLPTGYRFSLWKLEDATKLIPNTMPAYGVEVYATYAPVAISLYVDYNYGTADAPVDLKETMQKNNQLGKGIFYGVDVVNDIPDGEKVSIDANIRSSTVTTKPGEKYEVVDWNVYYVENEEDVYNPEKWKKGYNEVEGSTVAKYTLIYQVKWMAHKDFLFRVYNTNGELRSAMDKKFNKYFWYNNKPATKETAVPLNALPDRLVILGFLPKFEFDDGFAISIEPLTLSKAWLNPKNWGSLLEALFNGISSGFGGELW